ncbi:DUF4328 domain-containing protein [Micromonospora sp. WMMD882]|uniref:DUF4328 domain-containing protein n=1 Tax=Micromonospora sp. WMMD882 TaxID=3015151 RepID=UPI00248C3FE0|nr:DUF4328 domain-containing protein [Micromonospora sp. WMMD882]WBB77409.1 DUF4328 domain-containing protein [Micromonospora sp. WMMD882]
MPCHTCGRETDSRRRECETCDTPVGEPAVRPDQRTFPVRGVGRAASVAVAVTALCHLVATLFPLPASLAAERAARRLDPGGLLVVVLLDGAIAVAYVLAFLVAAVLVIVWCHRARRNLDAFPGAGPTLATGWAVAGWLVPFVNVVVPYRVVANITRDSLWQPATPPLVKIWWAAWLVFYCGGSRIERLDRFEPDLPASPATPADFAAYVDHYRGSLDWELLPGLACLVAGVTLVALIERISAAQQARIDRAQRYGPVTPGMVVPSPGLP